jgi:hypothetical protein
MGWEGGQMGRCKEKRVRSVSKRADDLCRKLKPHIVEMIEKNDQAVAGLDFNQLEALAAQPPATDAEIALARREALKKADPDLAAGKEPEDLQPSLE